MTLLGGAATGLAAGLVIGLVLEKARVFEPAIMLGQLRWRNFIVLKVMLSALATVMVGIGGLHEAGLIAAPPKLAVMGTDLAGGLLFGAGFALARGCPALILARIGAGHRDAWVTFAGVVGGAVTFVMVGAMVRKFLTIGVLGALSVDHLTPIPGIALAIATAIFLFAVLVALERLQPWCYDLAPSAEGLTGRTDSPPRRTQRERT